MNRTCIFTFLFVTLAILLGLSGVWLQSPAPNDAPPNSFSAMRALELVKVIANKPHPVGSDEDSHVRGYLFAQMKELGLNPRAIESKSDQTPVVDLYGELAGAQSTKPLILFVAHYDSVPGGPGAADDAAGVATILETVRAVKAQGPLRNRLAVLFTDGEESGLLGAEMFVHNQQELLKDVRMVVNLEARGNHGPVNMFQTGSDNNGLIRHFARACPFPVAASFSQDVYRRMPNDTDFTEFLKVGKQGLNFAFVGGLEYYHSRNDTPENLSLRTLQHEGACVLGVAEYFGNAGDEVFTNIAAKGDGAYFTLCRGVLAHYPAQMATVFAWVAAGLFVFMLAVGFFRSTLRVGRVAASLGVTILAMVLGVGMGVGGVAALIKIFKVRHYGPYIFHVPHESAFLIGLLVVAGIMTLALRAWLLRKANPAEILTGGLIVWVSLTLTTNFLLPGASYLFMLPTLFGTFALLFASKPPNGTGRMLLGTILMAMPAPWLLAPSMFLLHEAITIGIAPLFLALTAMAVSLFPSSQNRLLSDSKLPDAGSQKPGAIKFTHKPE